MTEEDFAPEQELRALVEALGEHLRWQAACGTSGLPRAEPASRTQEPVQEPPSPPARALRLAPPPDESPAPPLAIPEQPRDEAAALKSTLERAASQRTTALESPASPEERLRKLAETAETVKACTRCALHAGRTQTVFFRGSPSTDLMIVGEGPGADEDAQGEPFVGKAGQLLDRMIGAMGYGRDDVYICNIVKCRPPENRKPEPEEMRACMPYLHEQIAAVAPKVIVAMGGTAVQGLLGISEGITRVRGKWKLYRATIPVMPTFHPAYLLRTEAAKRDVWEDLKQVLKFLGKPIPAKGR